VRTTPAKGSTRRAESGDLALEILVYLALAPLELSSPAQNLEPQQERHALGDALAKLLTLLVGLCLATALYKIPVPRIGEHALADPGSERSGVGPLGSALLIRSFRHCSFLSRAAASV